MPKYTLLKYFTKETKCPVSICHQGLPIVLATLLKKDICLKEYGNNKIFEKGQMPIFKTHKIPAQAQLYYIYALCKLWGAQASSLQKKSRAWNSMVMLLSNFSGVSLLLEVGTVT